MNEALPAGSAVVASAAVCAGEQVVKIVRGVDGEFLLLGAQDDLRQGVRCREFGGEILAGLLDRYDDLEFLPPGFEADYSSDSKEWSVTPGVDYSRIDYEIDEQVRWIGESGLLHEDPTDEPLSVTRAVLDGHPIVFISHDSAGEWYFMSASDEEPEELNVFAVSWKSLLSHDPSVGYQANLPLGWEAARADERAEWVVGPG